MKVAGVVCEYNPFHNGHAYHLSETRKAGATHIVAVMSGCFVQRGTGAYCDPWTRARAAVRCGADLVLELPVPFSCGSAGVFARGAVELLNAFGIDVLSFGAETDDPVRLQAAADACSNAAVRAEIQRLHANGTGYPAAVQQAVEAAFGPQIAGVLAQPNNTLAVEYLKAAKALNATFLCRPVRRIGPAHDAHTQENHITSALALRQMKTKDEMRPFLPDAAFREIFAPQTLFFDEAAFETAVLCALRMQSLPDMECFIADDSGLAARVFASSRSATNLPGLYAAAQTKSVTASKVRRAVLHCFLQLEKNLQKQSAPYLRPLAANQRGLELLRRATPTLPVLTKHRESAALPAKAQDFYALQCRCTDLYAALCKPKGTAGLAQKHAMTVINL